MLAGIPRGDIYTSVGAQVSFQICALDSGGGKLFEVAAFKGLNKIFNLYIAFILNKIVP